MSTSLGGYPRLSIDTQDHCRPQNQKWHPRLMLASSQPVDRPISLSTNGVCSSGSYVLPSCTPEELRPHHGRGIDVAARRGFLQLVTNHFPRRGQRLTASYIVDRPVYRPKASGPRNTHFWSMCVILFFSGMTGAPHRWLKNLRQAGSSEDIQCESAGLFCRVGPS